MRALIIILNAILKKAIAVRQWSLGFGSGSSDRLQNEDRELQESEESQQLLLETQAARDLD